ncbi:MAG: response regulator [Phycisphaerae bacterium]
MVHTRRLQRPINRIPLGTLIVLASVVALAAPRLADAQIAPQAGRHQILLLHSYHAGYDWTEGITRGFREEMSRLMPDAEVHIEYMDSKRWNAPDQQEAFHNWLQIRYRNVPISAIVSSDDNALAFLLKHRGHVAPGQPIVFCGVNDYDPNQLVGHPEITGVVETLEVRQTLDLARKLRPGVRRVLVVTDNSPTGVGQQRTVRKVEDGYPKLKFEYLDGHYLTSAQLADRIAAARSDAVVLWMVWMRDRDGYVDYTHWLPAIADRSPVPIFGCLDLWLGHGIVGGRLTTGSLQGEAAAGIAARILQQGAKPSQIPVQMESPTQFTFDYPRLQQWGIPVSALPPGSQVIDRPYSPYEEYRYAIWAATGVVVVLSLLVAGLAANIIRRRRAEQQLRRERESLETILEASPYGVLTAGPYIDSACSYCNRRFTHITGYELSDVPTVADWLQHAFPDPSRRARQSALWKTQAQEGFAPEGQTVEITCRSGQTRHVHLAGSRMSDQRVMLMIADVTRQVQAEEDREHLQAQIQHAQKLESLGVLAGGIAHDFNNLLVGILGNADLALMEMSDLAPARPSVEEIKNVAVRASELTQQMLAYSGKGRFVIRAVNLNDLVEEMLHLLEISITKKAVLQRYLARELPPVEADVSQLRQVVMNLITNASDAVGESSGTITLRTGLVEADEQYLRDAVLERDLQPGRYVWLEVSDTGCGMDEKTQARIFDPFFTTKFAGRGLGLAAVLGIIRGHGGTIRLYSEVGRGTTFKVLLPACERTAEESEPSLPDEDHSDHDGKAVVLLADDERTVRDVASRLLERKGFDVILAEDGREAVEVFRREIDRVDVVVLDMTMPHLNGEEAFREIRRLQPNVPVLLSSGYNEQETVSHFVGKGLAGFIPKPFESRTLIAKVREAVGNNGNEAPANATDH